MSTYTFDVKLLACICVNAVSEREARAMIKRALDCARVNAGRWADGSPILFGVWLDGEPKNLESTTYSQGETK